jgi:hypothetical protein
MSMNPPTGRDPYSERDPYPGRDPYPEREPYAEPGAGGGARSTTSVPPRTATGVEPGDDRALAARHSYRSTGPLRLLAILVIVGGLILSIAGAITWVVVTDQLSDEKIVVSDDAENFAGDKVDGPFTAYAEAEVINDHALEDTDGQTYAQLDRDDPRRENVMTASFLRASLFTSVVSFGVAAFAFGLGLLLILIGLALLRVDKSLRAVL